mgnify:CR=1 FL=1
MKNITFFVTFTFFTTLYGCTVFKNQYFCTCCQEIYTSIAEIEDCKETNEVASKRTPIVLLAFTQDDKVTIDDSTWTKILKDKEIIEDVKRRYLLVVLSKSEKNKIIKKGNREINKVIEKYNKDELFFVMVAQDIYYSYWDWNENEDREIILGNLNAGAGP